MDTVVQALQKFFSEYVVALAVLIVAAVWAIWKLAATFQSMRDKVKGIEELPCAQHNAKIEKQDDLLADTRALMSRMEGQLELLVQSSIEKTNNKMRNKKTFEYTAKHSPRRLNKLGEDLLRRSGGDKFLADNIDFFIKKLEILAPKTALDVEEYASAVLLANTNDDRFIPLKSWVYNEPTREVTDEDGNKKILDVGLDDVVYVMSIPLRDRYLELHPELPR